MKYIRFIRERFNSSDFPVFKLSELRLIRGVSEGYLKLLVHNMAARGEITRITKGIYTFHHDADVVCFAFSPSYYGLEDALSRMHISDQGTNPLVMTLRNVRSGVRQFEGRNYLVHHIDKRFFFGYEQMKQGGFWVPVSDLEKTIIDMLYFRVYIRDELWREIVPKLKSAKLNDYLKKYEPEFRKRVLNEIRKQRHAGRLA